MKTITAKTCHFDTSLGESAKSMIYTMQLNRPGEVNLHRGGINLET